MDKNERRICWYSSLLIALIMNSAKLLALRENGIMARYWHFDLFELSFQFLFNLAFCWLMFYLNLNKTSIISIYRNAGNKVKYRLINIAVVLVSILSGNTIQYLLFSANRIPGVFRRGYFARFGLSSILIAIIIKIILMLREAQKRNTENALLKNAYMAAELELLKEQMNPHFLFNSLSSLSGIIREDAELAQKYVKELSNVFRYTISQSKVNLVTVQEELTMLRSFAQLITMRLENAFELHIDIPESYLAFELPHLSLQPLLENAVKHNVATKATPLKVNIFIRDNYLVVSNISQPIPEPEGSTGLGLANLNERFKLMMQNEIEITSNSNNFTVALPLKHE